MAFIRYEEAEVLVGFTTLGTRLMATNVTVSENMPLTPVRSIGYNGAIAVMPSGPPEGSFSITYNINIGSREKCDGAGTTVTSDATDFWQSEDSAGTINSNFALRRGYDTSANLSLSIGGGTPATALFNQGFCTSFSISAEPNAVVTPTLNGSFFDCGIQEEGGGIVASTALDGNGELSLLHGSNTSVANPSALGFNCSPFSANYEASRGTNPVYSLGSLEARFVQVTDPQESITLQGENLPAGVMKTPGGECDPCTDMTNASFTVNSLCNDSAAGAGKYTVCGPVQSRDIEVSVDDVLRGNITVVDYTFQQSLPTLPACS